MVALWLQKIVKSKRIDGINVKPQQHIAIKENQFRKILMPFKKKVKPSVHTPPEISGGVNLFWMFVIAFNTCVLREIINNY